MSDHDLFYGDFERDGEEVVRRNLSLGKYQRNKATLAELWLKQKDEARRAASTADQTAIARSATEASWVSAKASTRANIISLAALVVSVVAAAIAVAALMRT